MAKGFGWMLFYGGPALFLGMALAWARALPEEVAYWFELPVNVFLAMQMPWEWASLLWVCLPIVLMAGGYGLSRVNQGKEFEGNG